MIMIFEHIYSQISFHISTTLDFLWVLVVMKKVKMLYKKRIGVNTFLHAVLA